VGADVATGAIEAGGEIAAAAVDMVQTAAESLASVATGGVRDRPSEDPGADAGDDDKSGGEGQPS